MRGGRIAEWYHTWLWTHGLWVCTSVRAKTEHNIFTLWGAAIAQWICLCLTSCRSGFESQAHHLRFFHFILFKLYICHLNCNVKRTKINKKRPGLSHFLKKTPSLSTFRRGQDHERKSNNYYLLIIWMLLSAVYESVLLQNHENGN